jgi:hypothetical protein
MLTAMAWELVENRGIGEPAELAWAQAVILPTIRAQRTSFLVRPTAPPTPVKIARWVLCYDLCLSSAVRNHALYTCSHGDDHVPKCFDAFAIGHLPACGNNAEFAVCPPSQGFQESVKCSALSMINRRIAIPGKYLFAQIDQVCEVKMGNRVGITLPGLLPHNMDRFAIEIKRHDFEESNTRAINSDLDELR